MGDQPQFPSTRSLDRQLIEQCITECLACHLTCLRTAAQPGLELGGKHTEARHFRLMLDCSHICQTTADFLLRGSEMCEIVCAACALVCEACACSCEQTGDLEECVWSASRCARSCRRLAS